MRFTERSVVCADRIVAINSWNGFECVSSVTAGYSSRSRCAVSSARWRAPRGGGGSLAFFLALGVLGAKELARRRRDLRPLSPAREPCRGRLHHGPKPLWAF